MKTGAFIVPTGIGASVGGFAGDASKWARRLAKKCKLIVNPNVVNAACFSGITENMLYVEGYTLDRFFKGEIGLKESKNNKIGIVFDKAIPQNILNIHINTINAVKTVYDINIHGYEITEENVGVEFFVDDSGISTGNVRNLTTIKKAAENLIEEGCNAIRRCMTEPGFARCTVAMNWYLFRALEKTGLYHLTDRCWDVWRRMIANGCTTCVESEGYNRSECHAWGSLILYELPSVTLGVRPASPGYETVEVVPVPGYLDHAEGTVHTPRGDVRVEWYRSGSGIKCHVEADKGIHFSSNSVLR